MPPKTKSQSSKKNTPAKKAAAKKAVAKKPSVKKVAAKKKTPAKKAVAKMSAEEVPVVEKIIHRFEKRFVFVPLCDNCDHVPMRINRLVALMTVLIVILSGIVIAQGQPIDISRLLVALAGA